MKIGIACYLAVITRCLFAETATVNGITWTYTVSNGEAELVEYTLSEWTTGAITIPAKLNGYPVTGIGKNAFSYFSGLTGVTIPDSVTYIGRMAFYGCGGLKSVTIPISVMSDFAAYQIPVVLNATDYNIRLSSYYALDDIELWTVPRQ